MTKEGWEALGVQTHGLPSDLVVPIAAADLQAIETYVGAIKMRVPGRKRATNAVVVEANRPVRNPLVPLWEQDDGDDYYEQLHPSLQLWVHVDYRGYRRAWTRLGLGELTRDVVLDHVLNRAVVRLTGYRHPFVRMCPISQETNTSGGLNNGGEGMQKDWFRDLDQQSERTQREVEHALAAPVVLADPIDMTKMLDIPPGLTEMQGAASMLMKFYARNV